MALTLREKQSVFAKLAAILISHAYDLGYEITLGEAWRSPEEAKIQAQEGKGITHSLHIDRLALDINLFKDGKFLEDASFHKPLGEWWETLSTTDYTCCWGGRFGDGNHYSIEHEGRK